MIGGLKLVQIQTMRPQLAFESDPIRRRMRVIEVRGLAIKPFASVLFFVSALGKPDMGLGGEFAFFEGVHDSRHNGWREMGCYINST